MQTAAATASSAPSIRPGRKVARPPSHPFRSFLLWFALPTAAVFVSVCLLVVFALRLMSEEMNAIEATRGHAAIAAAVESIVLSMGDSASDEATWTEAYLNTYVTPNPAWHDATWGATARISSTYDTALVTDAEGRIVFGESSRSSLAGQLSDHFTGVPALLTRLDAALALQGDAATVASIAGASGGQVAALAGAVVRGNSGQANIPAEQRRILWLARRIDDTLLRNVAGRFQLPAPRLVSGHPAGQDLLVLTDAAGQEVASVAWQPRRPGDPAFAHAAGIAAALMLVIGLLTTAVLVAFWTSVRRRAEADEREFYTTRYDPVTGLPNAFGLIENIQSILPRKRGAMDVAIAQIAVEGLTDIIDSYGRAAGDRLLDTVADRIEAMGGGKAILARTEPTEFTLARVGDGSTAHVQALAERILALGNAAIAVDDLRLKPGFSIGLANGTATMADVAELQHRAETALARARETGGRHIVAYDPAIERERQSRLELQADIRRGLEADEFDLEYQPIIDFETNAIIGVEALMRWPRRAGGPIWPGDFIPEAERSGLIDELGMFALRRAIEDIGPLDGLKVSVNVSAAQLRTLGLSETVGAMLEEWQMPPERLQLEVTESFLVTQPDRAKLVLDALRERGMSIALDDFGTGYSSVGYLRQFAFDRVKLDRSLVAGIDSDAAQYAMVESTMLYAFAMGLAVTAEGVETPQEAAALARLGCREFQGYLFSRPVPLARLKELLAHNETPEAALAAGS